MPQPPRQKSPRVQQPKKSQTANAGLAQGTQGAPNDALRNQEIQSIIASIHGPEQAPSMREQTGSFVNWRQVFDQLGDPFKTERIAISRLRQMRRDPIIGFGMSFIKTPLIKADWYIKCEDAQVAAFVDDALRVVYGSLVLQLTQSLDFGFQAIAKRFELRTPTGTYIDPNSDAGTESPIWNQGSVQPVMLKTFVPLEPETVQPIFDKNTGEFAGIDWKPVDPAQTPARTGMKKTQEGSFMIDLYHSLWATNERDSVGGNIFGYPRLGYIYQYWWSYWFRWAIADRAFEKKADPSILIRHPDGQFVDERTGSTMSYREYALLMGDRLRSGSTVALPSEPFLGFEDRPTNIRQWDIEFIKDGTNFDPFDKSFDYLDIQKLRGLWIPEQALVEGRGGTSSRNVAATFGDAFVASQAVIMTMIDDIINRFIIPQLVIVNFPQFQGDCRKVTRGFASEDVEFSKQVVQLIGQGDPAELVKYVDVRETLREAGVPLKTVAQQKAYEQQLAAQAATAAPPATPPVPGQAAGVVANPQSATGFSYIQPRDVIAIDSAGFQFADDLPKTPHFDDKAIRTNARALWTIWHEQMATDFENFAAFLEETDLELSLDAIDEDGVELSVTDKALKIAKKVVSKWEADSEKFAKTISRTEDLLRRSLKRAAALAKKNSQLKDGLTDNEISAAAQRYVADMLMDTGETTRDSLTRFVASQIDKGTTDKAELARVVRQHFDETPKWKATQVARTATTDIFNLGTLMAGKAGGLESAQAIDGEDDEECRRRNGKIFPIDDAISERDHPNGTLHWRLLGVNLSVRHVDEAENGYDAQYDRENNVITFSSAVSREEETEYLLLLGERLAA